MSEELKVCPYCRGGMFYEWDYEADPIYANSICLACGATGPIADDIPEATKLSNTRPLEDALRTELAAANAEIARLREIVRKVEFCEEVQITDDGYMYTCPLCESTVGEGHTIACPFYQWEAPYDEAPEA